MNRDFLVELRGRGKCQNDGLSVLMFSEWEKSISQYCFQGGYGHSFNFKFGDVVSAHHWCVKPRYINMVLNSITDCIKDIVTSGEGYITIKRNPEHEQWSI